MAKMRGRRLPDTERTFEPGDYAKREDGKGWYIRPPGGHIGWVSTEPGHHTVIEHEDGTITVDPSILHKKHDGTVIWHGYLREGWWEDV